MGRKRSDKKIARDNARRGRSLHLHLDVEEVPRGLTRNKLIDLLQMGIRRGIYEVPNNVRLTLSWKNGDNPETPWRSDPYSKAMRDSSQNGRGFDAAVYRYLEGQRRQEQPKEQRMVDSIRREYDRKRAVIEREYEAGRIDAKQRARRISATNGAEKRELERIQGRKDG